MNRIEQLDGQAAEHARLIAMHDAEADRIADEIIDRVLAENPSDPVQIARRDESYERELESIAARIESRGEIETGTLHAIRRAMTLRQVRPDIALTLAYRLGSKTRK
jgi:hypothetical protein